MSQSLKKEQPQLEEDNLGCDAQWPRAEVPGEEGERGGQLESLRFKGSGDALCLVIYLAVLRPVMTLSNLRQVIWEKHFFFVWC